MTIANRGIAESAFSLSRILLITVALTAGCLFAASSLPAGARLITLAAPRLPQNATPKIGSIVVTGNHTLNTDFIILSSRVKVGDPCTNETLDRIVTNLYSTGLFGLHSATPDEAIKVTVEENTPSAGLCKVHVDVDENDTIQQLSITGSGPIKPEEIQKLVHFKPGMVYNDTQFLADQRDIENLYRSKGFQATLTADSRPDPKNPGVLRVDILVARVASIKIAGNHRTKPRVILRAMKTKVGDYYNFAQLQKDKQKVYNLELFDDVTDEEPTAGPGRVNVVISVVEKRTGTVSVGVGYSNREQLVGRAEVSDNNFRGVAEQVSLLWETGGIANRNSVELGFTEPYIDKKNTSLSVQIYDKIVYRFANGLFNALPNGNSTGNDTRYYEQREGTTITVSRQVRESVRVALSLRAENVRTDNLDLDINNAQILQNGPIFVLGGSIIHNTRDYEADPVNGGFQSFNVQVGEGNLRPITTAAGQLVPGKFGDVTFAKTSIDLRRYISLQGKRTKPGQKKSAIALRLMLGTSAGNLPFFEQFFVGGAESLRGYREDRFWGSNLLLGSIEYRRPLANALTGVLFIDVGDAWGGNFGGITIAGFNQPAGFEANIGVGTGIRVKTPLGPLRLDFGVGREGGRAHFSIGNVF